MKVGTLLGLCQPQERFSLFIPVDLDKQVPRNPCHKPDSNCDICRQYNTQERKG